MFNLTSVEQTELNGYQQNVMAACCVGGGSTIVCQRYPFTRLVALPNSFRMA